MSAETAPAVQPLRMLVAGGAGFLGSHFCDALLARGHHVVCLDDFSTGSAANLVQLRARPGFDLLQQDVCAPLDPSFPPFDIICNLACPASPVHYQRDPLRTVRTNVLGTLNLLELARRHEAVFFQASTSEVYGDPLRHPQCEDDWGHVNPIGVRACYDEGKRCAETLCMDYRRQHGLRIKIVRIFNTYGPRMHPRDGRVVSNFIVQALAGMPLTVYGTGNQTRSFCFVDDLIAGFLAVLDTPAAFTGPVNLGNPAEFTMLELAYKVIDHCGSSSKLEFRPLPSDDPTRRRPDITLARMALGWEPKISLDSGLKRTIAWFREGQERGLHGASDN